MVINVGGPMNIGGEISVCRGVQVFVFWHFRAHWYKARIRVRTKPWALIRQFVSIADADVYPHAQCDHCHGKGAA